MPKIAGSSTTIIGTPTAIRECCCLPCQNVSTSLVFCPDGVNRPKKLTDISLQFSGFPATVGFEFNESGERTDFSSGSCQEITYTRQVFEKISGLDGFNGTYNKKLYRKSDGVEIADQAILDLIAETPVGSERMNCLSNTFEYRIYVPTQPGTLSVRDQYSPATLNDVDYTEDGYWRVFSSGSFVWFSNSTDKIARLVWTNPENFFIDFFNSTTFDSSAESDDTLYYIAPLAYCGSCETTYGTTGTNPCDFTEAIETDIASGMPSSGNLKGPSCTIGQQLDFTRTNTPYEVDADIISSSTSESVIP